MIIKCSQCNTRYNLDDTLVRGKPSFKVRCSKCGNRFTVYMDDDTDLELMPKDMIRTDLDQTIAISNQKGGVAKTSTCINLGLSLSLMGKKVLLVDLDAQANMSISLGYSHNKASFFDILQSNAKSISDYIHPTKFNGLSILPSNSRISLLAKHYMNEPDFEFLLREKLATVSGQYDYILIDTPPSLGFCTLNALMAAQRVIIPTPCEYLAMHGIKSVQDIIKTVRNRTGNELEYRVLITMHDTESTAARVIFKKISNIFKEKMLQTIINIDQKMKESQIVHLPVYHYDKRSSSAQQYQQLAREIAAQNA